MEVQILLKKHKKIQVLRWLKLGLGRLKLNLDRSSLGNPGPAGGGGVLRGSVGNFIFGFSKSFGSCSNNEVELRAVVEGITICKHLGHDGIDIECDSDVVVAWIWSLICNLWEGNKVADALARHGASGRDNVFTCSSQLPGVIKDSQVAVVSRNGREVIKGGLELNDSAMVAELQEAIHKQIKSLICFRSFFNNIWQQN
ncbi:hypothetical protein LWI28_018560 [Acer negundo]|uniref:RNase H type-1 domain-containing protein n=1 Tax=Acer negundo TaxID=4023 RepID=A0AAD5P3I3_ACENE|nr:hypothetical protein LWI28_018560 [Acer negundo]